MYILGLVILGLILRLININKPEGLWNDEYVSWMTAATPFNNGFWESVIKQCHMPLYYLYLKPFAQYSDLILRLTSVIPSILAIPVMYLVGREFSKKIGYISAAITAVLPFLVYYSQEVRFYSLVFLITALVLLFTIRVLKEDSAKNWLWLSIASLTLLLTHHLGLIYIALTALYIIYKKRKINKTIIYTTIITALILLPLGIIILKQLPSSQWWGKFSYTNIMFLMSDFFSPILTNNINAPGIFFYNKDIVYNILQTFPTIIALGAIIAGGRKAKGFTVIALCTVIVMAILALTGTVVFITKYLIEILPILILMAAFGFSENKLTAAFLGIFLALQIFATLTPYYPAKLFRDEGHKLVGDMLSGHSLQKVVFTYYAPDRFYRYWKSDTETRHISKINRFDYIDNPAKILEGTKRGERVGLVILQSVSFIPPEAIDNAEIFGTPEMFITFSKIKNSLIEELSKNYLNFEFKVSGSWLIIIATKK